MTTKFVKLLKENLVVATWNGLNVVDLLTADSVEMNEEIFSLYDVSTWKKMKLFFGYRLDNWSTFLFLDNNFGEEELKEITSKCIELPSSSLNPGECIHSHSRR